jgi:hypothetical protein
LPTRLHRISLVFALALACSREQTEPPAVVVPALHATAGATVEQLCDDRLRSWAVLGDGGRIVARTRGTCLGPIDDPEAGRLWQFVAQLQAEGEPQPRWELYLWLDPHGNPSFAELRTAELLTRFYWDHGQLHVRRLGDVLVLDEPPWVTPEHAVYVHELMLRLGIGRSELGMQPRAWVPERDAVAQLELALERTADDLAQAHVGATVLALRGAGQGLAGLEIELVQTDAPIYRALTDDVLADPLPPLPSPRYRLPAVLETAPIELVGEAGRPTLAGELVLPAGSLAATQPQRRPAVLFIGGAGPQDRYGFVPESSVDIGSHELHDLLAAAGFAVLRMDDRGVGGSSIGDEPSPGFVALVEDHRRALAALAGSAHVDPEKIVLIGHGEGALVASILAGEGVRARGRKRNVAGLILLAGPGRNLRELVYDEIRASLAGHREGELRTAVDRARRVHEAALANAELPASSEGARQWMIEAFAEDPLKRLAKVRAPVLALQGGKDFQVNPAADFAAICTLLDARAREHDSHELFAELDHLFKPEPGVSTPGHYADLRRHVDAAVLERISSWALLVTRG